MIRDCCTPIRIESLNRNDENGKGFFETSETSLIIRFRAFLSCVRCCQKHHMNMNSMSSLCRCLMANGGGVVMMMMMRQLGHCPPPGIIRRLWPTKTRRQHYTITRHYFDAGGATTSSSSSSSDKSSDSKTSTSDNVTRQQQPPSADNAETPLYLHVGPSNDCWISHEMFAAKHLQPDYVKSIQLPGGVKDDNDDVVEEVIRELEENPEIVEQVYDTGILPEKYMKRLRRRDSGNGATVSAANAGVNRESPAIGSRSFCTTTDHHQQAMGSHHSQIIALESTRRLLTSDPRSWTGRSILSVEQLTPDGLSLMFRTAQQMKDVVQTRGGDDRLKHKILATVFYEASTRTCASFQAAMQRLGGSVIHVDGKTSSIQKGEGLSDTVRCMECYADVTVLRHPLTGSFREVASTKPVVNAGDGTGEHPAQALVDLFTICDELQLVPTTREQVTIVMLGDLKHGRTVHSLAKLLARCGMKIRLRYCGPDELTMPQDVQDYVSQHSNITQETVTSLNEAIQDANVLYVTRIQKERFETLQAYKEVKGTYQVDAKLMEKAPSSKMILMHPLPRVDEISADVDEDPRAAYFRQMQNGMFVRMALLALVLGKV